MICSVSYPRFVPIFGLLLISLGLPSLAQQTDTTSADLKTPADSTEVQSPIDTPDHCPAPGDYAPIEGIPAWSWMEGVVKSYITNPYEVSRPEDTDHLTLDQLRPLIDSTDAETCRQIQNKVPVPPGVDAEGQDRVLHAYFQAGAFYFAVTMAVPLDPDEAFLGIILHIYDENLNFITGYL